MTDKDAIYRLFQLEYESFDAGIENLEKIIRERNALKECLKNSWDFGRIKWLQSYRPILDFETAEARDRYRLYKQFVELFENQEGIDKNQFMDGVSRILASPTVPGR